MSDAELPSGFGSSDADGAIAASPYGAEVEGAGLSLTVHRIRVTLLGVAPPIWRELRVPSVVGLHLLHAVVQIAMGWEDCHLHEWQVNDLTYVAAEEEDWGEGALNEADTTLADIAVGDTAFRYVYDLGDEWEHLVEVLSVERYDPTLVPLACLDGKRACPPEDCGGPSGYEHLLDALNDPDDSEHLQMVEAFQDVWSPEEFDLQRVNERLEELWRAT